MKRKVAIAVASAVLLLAGAALGALRTAWAGDRLCALAAARLRAATGVDAAAGACRVDPFRLEVSLRDLRVGPPGAPLVEAEAVRIRLAPVQALGRRLELRDVEIVRPRVRAALPASPAGAPAARCPPAVLDRFEVHRLSVEGGALDLALPGGERVVVDAFTVRSTPPARRRGLAALSAPGVRRTGLDVAVAGARIVLRDRTLAVDAAHVDGDVALDLSRADVRSASIDAGGVRLSAEGSVVDLCRPRLELRATARGELADVAALLGARPATLAGTVAAEVRLDGPAAAPRADGEVKLAGARVGAFRPGDARARMHLAGRELRIDGLEVPAAGGRLAAKATVRLGREVGLDAEAQLDRVELGEIFERLGLPGAWVMMRVSGRLRAAGTAWPLALDGSAALDFTDFRALTGAWDRWRPGERPALEVPRGRVEGQVRVTREGVRITAATVRAGAAPALAATAMLHFAGERGFEVRADGGIDLSLLRHVGPVPIGGAAVLENVVVRAAPYGNPHIEGRARVEGFRFLDLDLGDAAARLDYDDFVLRVEEVAGRRGATRYDGRATVDLGAAPVRVDAARFAADGRLRDLFEAAMPWQPKARHARDVLDGDVHVRGTARGPAVALDAAFEGELGEGALAGRRFDGGRFAGRVERGERAAFERAELRRGGGAVRGSGRVDFAEPFPWSFDAFAKELPLAAIGLPGSGWTGTVSGDATVRGSFEDPVVRAAAHGEGVGVLDVAIGAVEARARLDGTALAVDASAEGAKVRATATAAGDAPYEASAELDVDDVARYLPGGPPAGLHARVRGVGSASGTLADVASSRAELRLDEVHGGYGDFHVDAAPPVVIGVEAGRVKLASFSVTGANTSFVLEGARERSGELGLTARGALDLRLLAGLIPGVAEPRGQLAVEAHVGGSVADPLLVGTGALRDGAFRMRSAPVAFTSLGGDLSFSHNRMLFEHVTGLVNGGRAELEGEAELKRLRPVRVRVGASLDEVPLRIPEWLPSVVSGDLKAAGTWEDMLLSGKLHVVRARYTDPVDLEKSMVEVRRKRRAARPFDPADAWLKLDVGLVVDGDARVENDLVRGGAKGELTLTGSLASIGLVGSLSLDEGSRANFRGNEFALSHAVVDFTDRFKVRMRLDVHGEAQVRDYQIFMHLAGEYPDPVLQLTSQPALSREDIVTLLSLGFTSRDSATAVGMTGAATAAAAQALFSASGLDDQVKRFVPRGKLLRDFSVRMTTAYSEAVGQVEPRAELESRVLDDRFRLRYQAPLSGARGQRAQAEMRLGDRTSLQYQWDNDTPSVGPGGDHGVDLKLRLEWND